MAPNDDEGAPWAIKTAEQIVVRRYPNMSVTYSRDGEYTSSEDVLLPLPIKLGPDMTVDGAAIIAKARSYKGVLHDGPDVPMMARAIAQAFPDDLEIAKYVTEATNTMPWCGDFIPFVLKDWGIKPPPVKDGVGFFYVDRWLDFGTPVPVGQEHPGDVAIFLGNPHHVTFVAGGGKYVGGNQSDGVTETSYRTPDAIRRPPGAGVQPSPAPAPSSGVNTKIIATNFHDAQVAYSDVAPGWNDRFGVSLPYRFPKGPRLKIKVTNRANGKSVVCEIMDVGPWYDDREGWPFDPYWQTGKRPRAESDPRTNGAGIDLTLPADAAIGLGGKGLVDWEFVTTDQVVEPPPPPPPPPPVTDEAVAYLQLQVDRIGAQLDELELNLKEWKNAMHEPTPQPAPPQIDWGPILKAAAENLPALFKLLPLLLPLLAEVWPFVKPLLVQWLTGRAPVAAPLPVAPPPPPATGFAIPQGTVTGILGLIGAIVSGLAPVLSQGAIGPEISVPAATISAGIGFAGGAQATRNALMKPKAQP